VAVRGSSRDAPSGSIHFKSEIAVFNYKETENAPASPIKREHLKQAQQKWERLSETDLAAIRNPTDLIAVIQERYSLSRSQAERDVTIGSRGKKF
jgi:hypothetical protein